jgi:Tol biopolymer transport system component
MKRFPTDGWRAGGRLVPAAVLAVGAMLSACTASEESDSTAPPGNSGGTSYSVSVTVTTAMLGGESFVFSLGSQQVTVSAANSATAFAQALSAGSSYTVNQVSGPRTCTLSANRAGTISANVDVTAACGTAAATTPLTGRIFGPAGAQATLQNNGGDNVTATVAANFPYNFSEFTFPTQLVSGAAYNVTVAGTSANQTCRVYMGAAGTVPVASGALRVGCERTFDKVTRNDNDTAFGTFFDSQSAVVGGANGAVGNTSVGYGEGRFVAFVSYAAMGGSTGARRQVFLRDRFDGKLYLVSATAAGVEGNGDSWNPAISADGLTVVFESSSTNLVANDTNGVSDIFLWSALSQNGVQRVSVGSGGVEANAASVKPTISGSGNVIAFESGASNLTAGVAGTSTVNVIRRDLASGTNTLISKNASGVAVGGSWPSLSEDGNRMAFHSYALVLPGDANGLWDVFVHDHAAGTTQRVSLTSAGGERNQGNESASRVVAPVISGDGRWVAYATTSTNLVPIAGNGLQQVYVVDTQTGAVSRASVNSAGTQGDAGSPLAQGERLALSYNGEWVAFTSSSNNLGVPTTTTGLGNVFMHNRVTGETRAVTSNLSIGSVGGPVSMSRSASYVVFGASTTLDPLYSGSGLFAKFTDLANAFFWLTN